MAKGEQTFCPVCGKEKKFERTFCSNHIRNISKAEIDVRDWLKQYIDIESNIRFKINEDNYKNMELDIFIPKHNIGIEYCGLYWHSASRKASSYHYDKWEKFKRIHNIDVIQIFENEWSNNQDIVKSIILNKIGKSPFIIYARFCTLRQISSIEYKRFCELNHLQGYAPASIRYGLFYNEELIQILSISKSRYTGNYSHEIIRSCSKLNVTVIGGFEKLIKNIIKNEKGIDSLISYVDLRYFNGKSYESCDFKEIKQSPPNYWYFKYGTMNLYHRVQFQKHKLKESKNYSAEKTEKEIMIEDGYDFIYDCGNKVFVWNRTTISK